MGRRMSSSRDGTEGGFKELVRVPCSVQQPKAVGMGTRSGSIVSEVSNPIL